MASLEQTDPIRDPNTPPKLHVLFPTGNRIDYDVTTSTSVSDLIQMINEDKSVQKPENRTISLIYHGTILQPTDILSKIDSMPEFTIHVFFRQTTTRKRGHKHKNEHQNTQSTESNSTTEEVRDNNADNNNVENEENNDDDDRLASDLRGFDRLARMNYTPEQIAEIRRNFHTMQGSLNSSPEAQIEAEEEWFPVIFNNNVVDGGAAGAARILLGIANNTPNNARPRRQRNRHNTNEEGGDENHGNDDNYDYEEQEGAREDDPENPDNNRNRGARNWAIFTDGNGAVRPDDDNDGSSWIRFAFGFIIGIIFGIGSIIFMLTSLNDRSMLAGLFVGTLSHYCITRFFESSS